MSFNETSPHHGGSFEGGMKYLAAPKPPFQGHQMFPSMFLFTRRKQQPTPTFPPLFPLNLIIPSFSFRCLWLCVSLPRREKNTHQQHQHTHGRIISHAAELPLTRRVHAGPPVATAPLMKQRRAAPVENRGGGEHYLCRCPGGSIISRQRR